MEAPASMASFTAGVSERMPPISCGGRLAVQCDPQCHKWNALKGAARNYCCSGSARRGPSVIPYQVFMRSISSTTCSGILTYCRRPLRIGEIEHPVVSERSDMLYIHGGGFRARSTQWRRVSRSARSRGAVWGLLPSGPGCVAAWMSRWACSAVIPHGYDRGRPIYGYGAIHVGLPGFWTICQEPQAIRKTPEWLRFGAL